MVDVILRVLVALAVAVALTAWFTRVQPPPGEGHDP